MHDMKALFKWMAEQNIYKCKSQTKPFIRMIQMEARSDGSQRLSRYLDLALDGPLTQYSTILRDSNSPSHDMPSLNLLRLMLLPPAMNRLSDAAANLPDEVVPERSRTSSSLSIHHEPRIGDKSKLGNSQVS